MSKDRSPTFPAPPGRTPHRPRPALVAAVLVAQALSIAAPAGYRPHGATPRHTERSPRPYLPVVGPAPLRLQAPPPEPSAAPTLPPLAMSEPTPSSTAASTNGPAVNPPPDPTEPAELPPAFPDPPKPETGSLMSDPAFPAPTAPGVITPQMLVQFFKPVGSNYLGGTWSVPVFVPPTPPPARSSTATYRSN